MATFTDTFNSASPDLSYTILTGSAPGITTTGGRGTCSGSFATVNSRAEVDTGSNDMFAELEITSAFADSDRSIGVFTRCTGAATARTGMLFDVNEQNQRYRFGYMINGTYSAITGFVSHTFAAPCKIRLESEGNTHRVYIGNWTDEAGKNAALVATYSNSNVPTGTYGGIDVYNGNNVVRFDNFLLGDLALAAVTHTRSLVDPVGITDAATHTATSSRSIVDPVGATDTVTPGASTARSLADTVGVTDQVAYTTGTLHTRSLTDPVGVTDTLSRQATLNRSTADQVGITDRLSAAFAYSPLTIGLWAVVGTELAPLPAFENLEVSRERNGVGSVSVDYPAAAPGFAHLKATVTQDRPVEVEIWFGGSRDGAERALLTQTVGDDLNGRAVWRFTGTFLEQILDDGIIYSQPAPAERGELAFFAKNPGQIVATVLQQVQARGALTGVTQDWSTSLDSSGQAWPNTVSGLKYSPRTTLLQILEDLVEKDIAEFELTRDRVLRLWAPDRRGVDRTAGTDPTLFRFGRVTASPVRHSTRETATAVLAVGADGLSATASDASAEARIGRRIEVGVDANNITDQGALLAYAQAALKALTNGQEELRHPLTFGPGDPRPKAGYDLADKVLSERAGGARRAVDVQQWTLTAARQRVTGGEVVLNDLIASRLQRLARQVERISSGAAVVGTSQPPSGADTIPPSAPTGLTADSIAYQDDEHSQTLAAVTLSWMPVTTDAAGPNTAQAQAAQLILDRMQSGQPIFEDWTWTGAPLLVRTYNDPLLAEFEASGSTNAQTWLAGYIAANSSGAVATDDVAGYRVQFAYLGLAQVGGIPSSNPEQTLLNWTEATASEGVLGPPLTFGGIEAGIRLGLRVAAFDDSGNQSAWSSVLEIDTAIDNTAPNQAATPTTNIWFRTLDITSNGLDINGAAMPVDFDHDEIWISQAASFTVPSAASTPTAFDPAVTGPQHVANLFGAGTWNQPDLPVDVGYYAARRSVDRAGNAGPLSPIAGPATAERLVQIDIGPNAIGRQQIIDLEVVRAKVDNLAVNSAKVEELSVGLLTTGTMTATVTNSGIFQTASSGNRVRFDSSGLLLYQGETIVGRWRTTDASMLMTGTYQSGLSGERINILPDGTLRFYPQSGTNYSQLANFGNDLVMRGVMDSNGRSGRVNANALGVGLNFSAESEIPNSLRSEMIVTDRLARTIAPVIIARIDGKLSPIAGIRRFTVVQTDSAGTDLGQSTINMYGRGLDGSATIFGGSGGQSGFVLGATAVSVVQGSDTNAGPIVASAFNPPSSETVKDTIRDARASLDPLATIRSARSKSWHYVWERFQTPPATPDNPNPKPVRVEPPTRFGPIAEDLPPVLQVEIPSPNGPGTTLGVSLGDQIGVLWGAVGQLAEDTQIRYVHASKVFAPSVAVIWPAGSTQDIQLTWDEAPLDRVRGADARLDVGVAWLGKLSVRVLQSTVTDTGCTVQATVTAPGAVVLNAANPLTVHATAAYLYTPPFQS